MQANDSRIVRVETVIDHINYRLDHIDKKFDELKSDAKEFRLDTKSQFDELKSELKDIRKDNRNHFMWIMGFILIIVGSPLYPQIIQTLKHILQK